MKSAGEGLARQEGSDAERGSLGGEPVGTTTLVVKGEGADRSDALDGAASPSAQQAPAVINYWPLFLVGLSGLGFSIQTLFIKILADELAFPGSFQIIFCRGCTQCILAAGFMYFERENKQPVFGRTRETQILLMMRSLFGYGGIAFAFLAVEHLPIGDATVLVMLSPLFASIVSYFVLGEPWRLGEMVSTLVSLVGVAAVSRPAYLFGADASADSMGVVYALLASVTAGFAYTSVRMLGTTHAMPWSNVCFAQSLGQIFLSPPSLLLSGQQFSIFLPPRVFFLVFTAGLIGAFSQIVMTIGMQREKSALATGMRMTDVVFGFIWQALFTNEAVSTLSLGGAFLVVLSVFILVGAKAYYPAPAPAAIGAGAGAGATGEVYSQLHMDSTHNGGSGHEFPTPASAAPRGGSFSIVCVDDQDEYEAGAGALEEKKEGEVEMATVGSA